MMRLPPAPDAVLDLVKCGCAKERCSTNRCQCWKAGLKCTDLCSCIDGGDEPCDNVADGDEQDSDENLMVMMTTIYLMMTMRRRLMPCPKQYF